MSPRRSGSEQAEAEAAAHVAPDPAIDPAAAPAIDPAALDAGGPGSRHGRSRWLSRRALGLHATVALLVPGFFALAWWQLTRALDGNTLSWAYTFEWPIFAGYAVFLWWKLVTEWPDRSPGTQVAGAAAVAGGGDGQGASTAPAGGPASGEPEDEELARYNAYLAALEASGRRKRW